MSTGDGDRMQDRKHETAIDQDHIGPDRAAAKAYLVKHSLAPFVESLLKGLITTRPEDPYNFIVEYVRRSRGQKIHNAEDSQAETKEEPSSLTSKMGDAARVLKSLKTLQDDVAQCMVKLRGVSSYEPTDIDGALLAASEGYASLLSAVKLSLADVEPVYKAANRGTENQGLEKPFTKELITLGLTLERALEVVDRVNPKTFGIGATSERFKVDAESMGKDPGQPDYFGKCPEDRGTLLDALHKITYENYFVCSTCGKGVAG